MRMQPIEAFMTPSPQCIQAKETVTEALRLMQLTGGRHLPVLEGETLVGIVSQRGLYRLETLGNVDHRSHDPVAEAMESFYVVERGAPIGEVAQEMAHRKAGAAIVVDGRKIIGIFTTTDALETLAQLLAV